MKRNANIARQQSGFSLVESLIAVSVATLALGASLPGFRAATERRHLDGTSAQLETDIQLARSEAVKRNQALRLSFLSTAAGSCYVIHTGKATDCLCSPTGRPVCASGAADVRSVALPVTGPVQVRSNVSSLVFDPHRGTVTPTGTLRMVSREGHEVRVIVNIMGRVRACTPNLELRGLPRC